MPTISEFFGIIIRMYYDDHNPHHFHAYYGSHEAIISIIETLDILEGSLPRRVKALVIVWTIDHRQALLEDWKLAEQHQPLKKLNHWSDRYAQSHQCRNKAKLHPGHYF